ncbi:MAG: hypothetical protein Q4D90_00925 [bacterium]|nr:hypothetical protein [bacterium]
MKSFFRCLCFFLLALFLFSFVPQGVSLAALNSPLGLPFEKRATPPNALSTPSNAGETATPNNASRKKQISTLYNLSLLTKPQVILRNDEETWKHFLKQLETYQQADPFLLVYGATDDGERVLLNLHILDSSEVSLEASGSYNVYLSFSVAKEYADAYELPEELAINSIPIHVANPAFFDLYYIGNTRDTMRFRYLYSVKDLDIELWYCKSEVPLDDEDLKKQEWSLCHKNSTIYDSMLLMPRELIQDQYFYYFQARTPSESSYILSMFIHNEQYLLINSFNGIRDESGRDEQSKPSLILPSDSEESDSNKNSNDDSNKNRDDDSESSIPENEGSEKPKPPLQTKPEESSSSQPLSVTAALFDLDFLGDTQVSASEDSQTKPSKGIDAMRKDEDKETLHASAKSQSEQEPKRTVTEEDNSDYTVFSGRRLSYLRAQNKGDSLRVTKQHCSIELPWSWKFFDEMTDNSSLKVGIDWQSKYTFLLYVEPSLEQPLPAITLHLPWEEETIPTFLFHHASGEQYALNYDADNRELEVTVTKSGLFSLVENTMPQSLQGMSMVQDFSGFLGFFDWSFRLLATLLFLSCIGIWLSRKI